MHERKPGGLGHIVLGSDPVGGFIALTSTGNSYLFRAYCVSADGTRVGPSGVDIGDTTNGLKNDGGSLDKR